MKLLKKYVVKFGLYLCFATVAVLFLVNALSPESVYATGFAMKYNSRGVSAKITASYMVGETKTKLKTNNGKNEIHIKPESEETGSFVADGPIDLDAKSSSVVFEYKVHNTASKHEDAIIVSVFTGSLVLENMVISYYASNVPLTNYEKTTFVDYLEPQVLQTNKDMFIYVKIEVDNLANSANFDGSICIGLEIG